MYIRLGHIKTVIKYEFYMLPKVRPRTYCSSLMIGNIHIDVNHLQLQYMFDHIDLHVNIT